MTGFAQVAFSGQANGSLIKVNGKVVGSKLAAQAFTARRTSTSGRRPPRPPTTPAGRPSPTSARRTQTLAKNVQTRGRGDPEARGPVQPGPDDPRHPGRRRHDLRLRHRPRHLARLRAAAGAPDRRRPPPAARDRAAADLEEHDRPLLGLLRRARRERARAQPRARPTGRRVMARKSASIFSRDLVARRDPRLVPEARPAAAVQEPGDVHRRARQRDHDRDLRPRPRARPHGHRSGSSA